MPDFRLNLTLGVKITDNVYEVIFKNNYATVINEKGNQILTANRFKDLYYITDNLVQCNNVKKVSDKSNWILWQNRLGHLNFKDVKELVYRDSIAASILPASST